MTIGLNIKQIWDDTLSLFFPAVCWDCQEVLRKEVVLCDACQKRLPFWSTQGDALHTRFPPETFAEATALVRFEHASVVQRLIHAFKYSKRLYVGEELARIGYARAEKTMALRSCHVIVPVPLHWLKRWRRGFNQSEILSRSFAAYLGIPFEKSVLVRKSYTKAQVGKDAVERRESMRGKFAVKRPEHVKGRRVMLVDDVVTTGSTVLACAEALKAAGATEVSLYALAATPWSKE